VTAVHEPAEGVAYEVAVTQPGPRARDTLDREAEPLALEVLDEATCAIPISCTSACAQVLQEMARHECTSPGALAGSIAGKPPCVRGDPLEVMRRHAGAPVRFPAESRKPAVAVRDRSSRPPRCGAGVVVRGEPSLGACFAEVTAASCADQWC